VRLLNLKRSDGKELTLARASWRPNVKVWKVEISDVVAQLSSLRPLGNRRTRESHRRV
jgi:hypothetical protein